MRLRSGLVTGPPGPAQTEAQQPTISNNKPKWPIRDATFFWPPDVAIVIRRRCGVENDNEDVPHMPGHYTRRQILKKPILSTSSKLFTTLPYELVYKILGFMQPKEYTGLTCTCRLAFHLTNTQVETERPGLGREYKMFVSYTGIYTALQEVEAKRERDGNPLCYPPLLEEEPDL
ncbi:hypothetical protein KCU93_g7713, partial [Aureobasidium melanogenum]